MKVLDYPGTKRSGLVLFTLVLIAALALIAPVAASVTVSTAADLRTAVSSPPADGIIIVEPGTYYASGMTVGNGVTIEADTANGHGPWDTIIDGSKSGSSIFTVYGHSLALDNLTIQNASSNYGCAIYAGMSSSITVTSSTFTGCSAGDSGGAIYAGSSSSITVTSSTFTGCSAGEYGGAISGSSSSSITVTSSTFTGCSAGDFGGAIYSHYSGIITVVTSSTFTGCSAGDFGGAICADNLGITVTSSTFTGCSAGDSGGAIYAVAGTIRFSRIYHDPLGTAVYRGGTLGTLNAPDNWWGTNSAPSSSDIGGGATASTWLVLGIAASPSTITTAGTSTISANLTYHTDGSTVSAVTGTTSAPNGTRVTFTATGGTVSPATAYTESGVASTTFTPSGTGTASITATVDGQSVTVPVTVTAAAAQVNATSIVIDPKTPANVYVGLDGSGIYNSTDGGANWEPAEMQPANLHIRALAINSSVTSTLYAGTYGGGVYYSTDSGADWYACGTSGLTSQNVLSLVRNTTGALYAGTEAGVFVSTDDCASWSAMNTGL